MASYASKFFKGATAMGVSFGATSQFIQDSRSVAISTAVTFIGSAAYETWKAQTQATRTAGDIYPGQVMDNITPYAAGLFANVVLATAVSYVAGISEGNASLAIGITAAVIDFIIGAYNMSNTPQQAPALRLG